MIWSLQFAWGERWVPELIPELEWLVNLRPVQDEELDRMWMVYFLIGAIHMMKLGHEDECLQICRYQNPSMTYVVHSNNPEDL